MLQGLSTVNGLNREALLNVTVHLLRLRDFPELEKTFLFYFIVPFCRGSLSERLPSVLARLERFQFVYREALGFLVPARLRYFLPVERFY